MAKSIYGFAQSATSSSQAITNALRLYNRAIAQGAGSSGVIDNPDIYRQARETYLAPLADNVQISTKIAESVNDENRMRDKMNDASLASSVFKESVNQTLMSYSKAYYKNPQNLVTMTAFVYNTAVDELASEIEARRDSGQSVGELQSMLSDYSSKANKMTRLARQIMASGTTQNPNAYGWFIKTNPDDGSIISMELDSADSTDKQSGFTRTAQYYGNIPVWANTVTDDTGKVSARIGQNKYELQNVSNSNTNKILKLVGSQYGGFFAEINPFDKTSTKEVKEKRRTVNLSNVEFGDVLNLPTGSIAKDTSGNYYYYGSDGVYKATSKDNLSKFLNTTGTAAVDVDANSYPISRDEVKSFGSFIDDKGNSRIIDDNFVGGLNSQSPSDVSSLPTLDKKVSGTISAAKLPSTNVFEVPRKSYVTKNYSQMGKPSLEDVMKDQSTKYASYPSTSLEELNKK